MFGAAVVAVIIAASIFLTYALDVQEETVTVNEYDYITDISGLFERSEAPQYNEYDLAKNYTGYFTAEDEPYWSGIGEYKTASVNNYRLNLKPTASVVSTENLWDSTLGNISTNTFTMYYGPNLSDALFDNQPIPPYLTGGLRVISMSDYITEQSLTDYDQIIMKPETANVEDTVLFVYNGYLVDSFNAGLFVLEEYKEYHKETATGLPIYVAPLSAKYVKSNNLVSLYSSATEQDNSTFLTTVDVRDVYIVFSSSTSSSPNPYGHMITYDALTIPPNEYLDITKGVRVAVE